MNCLVGQSGGPTAVINSSFAGVVQSSIDNGFDRIYACLHGIEGFLQDEFVEIDIEKFNESNAREGLKKRPSSILGSCRFKLPESLDSDIYPKIFEKLRKLNITSFIYIGGNDSMDTVKKLNQYMRYKGIGDINIVGCPKTIDNDLMVMDHSPGYGSALKFIVNALKDIRCDVDIYDKKTVTFVEIMGRNAGWLTAGTLVANLHQDKKIVNLVYVGEKQVSKEQILEDIKKAHEEEDNLIVAVSEGFMDKDYFFKEVVIRSYDEGFNHPIIAGISRKLSEYVYRELDIKTKAVEFSIVQRTSGNISQTDSEEAYMLGYKALELSKEHTNVIPIITRISSSPYKFEIEQVISDDIANFEKKIPQSWLVDSETLNENITEYALPLIDGEIKHNYRNGIVEYIKLNEFIK